MESYSDIELSDDEMTQAIIDAKRKKKEELWLEQQKRQREEARKIKNATWNITLFKSYLHNRSILLFGSKVVDGKTVSNFDLDEHNEPLLNLLCYYFLDDESNFMLRASEIGVKNPSLRKGLLIPGNFGVGKTWLMKLLRSNRKQSFEIVRSKDICDAFMQSEDKKIPEVYLKPWDTQDEDAKKWFNSDETFGQRYVGLCIDDLGSEPIKNSFGNKMNVIGDLIESRYANGFMGPLLHGTTNLTADQLKEFYGERVASRMKEIFNFIELPGTDRRK